MVSKDLIDAKDWDGITALTKEAVSTMLGFELRHVGINHACENCAAACAEKLGLLTSLPLKEGNSSIFVGGMFEVMKGKGPGEHGHIAIGTNYLERAIYHLQKRGFVFDESSYKYNDKGELIFAYLQDEISGFGIHFNQK